MLFRTALWYVVVAYYRRHNVVKTQLITHENVSLPPLHNQHGFIKEFGYDPRLKPVPVAERSEAAGLLRLWFRILPEAWLIFCFECCVLSGRDLCDGLITRPEESYRIWCVVVCDLETSWMKGPWPNGGGAVAPKRKKERNNQLKYYLIYVFEK